MATAKDLAGKFGASGGTTKNVSPLSTSPLASAKDKRSEAN